MAYIGLVSLAGVPYAPHWMELAVTVGLFSAGILAFGLAMKRLPLEEEQCAHNINKISMEILNSRVDPENKDGVLRTPSLFSGFSSASV